MSERLISTELKDFLLTNEPYTYFHLVSIERPGYDKYSPTYAYVTDSSINIFHSGETYIANKVLSVGAINETIEAKSSTLSLKLCSTTLGTIVSDDLTFPSDYSFTGTLDFTEEGYREGDRIVIDGITCTITGFTNSNMTVTVAENSFSGFVPGIFTITLASEEISALNSKLNYANKEVYINKVILNAEGVMVGSPILVFKGIIASGKLSDDPDKESSITWSLTSHWGDFVRVQGRFTSDEFHRALDENRTPNTLAVIRPEYALDKGFEHSEKAISLIAIYSEEETRYKLRSSGLFGMKKKLVSYQVDVDRELDLNFNLNAKYLPVVYGVRKVDSIPIFIDMNANNSNIVYVAYAICEGEIGAIYDIYIDDSPLVCTDAIDENVRGVNVGSDAVDVYCLGRADRGDVITGSYKAISKTDTDFWIPAIIGSVQSRVSQIEYDSGDAGTRYNNYTIYYFEVHHPVTGELIHTEYSEGSISTWFNSVSASNAINIKRADAISSGLYSVEKYIISSLRVREQDSSTFYIEGQTNYSSSFVDLPLGPYGTHPLAVIGMQTLAAASFETSGLIHEAEFTINSPIDISIVAHTGKPDQVSDTLLTNTSANEGFKLQTEYYEGPLADYWSPKHKLLDTSYIVAKYTISEGETQIPSLDFVVKGKILDCYNYDTSYSPIDYSNNDSPDNFELGDTVSLYELSYDGSLFTQEDLIFNTTIIDKFFIDKQDGWIETRFIFDDPDNLLSDYNMYRMVDGSLNQYSFASWDLVGDTRVSLNPAIQLLDYLTSARYGKGLKIFTSLDDGNYRDIDLDTFISAARSCDTTSDVTVTLTTYAAPDSVLTYDTDGFKFSGEVLSSTLIDGLYETVITNCIGKLGRKWTDWRIFKAGELVWKDGIVRRATSAGASAFDATLGSIVTSFSLGAFTCSCDNIDGDASGNPIVRSYSTSDYSASGYSLYDSDDVKYWKYVGWDSPDQRWVTRHQLNQVIRTENPLFNNVNSMLDQFNGMLRYSNGLYGLEIKKQADTSPAISHYIDETDIIGTILLADNSSKQSYNTLSTNIVDPQNKFDSRSISFFNSTYLAEDNYIQKQGQINLEGVTNYYNARWNTKQYLDDSRYKLNISFTMTPKGYLLLAGSIVNISYARFGWVNKQFRVTSLNLLTDGLVSINADEHSDEIYTIPNIASDKVPTNYAYVPSVPVAPTGLTATTTQLGTVTLNWVNSANFDPEIHVLQIYASDDNNRLNSTLIGSSLSDSITLMIDIPGATPVDKYFWVRYSRVTASTVSDRDIIVYSEYEPEDSAAGILGTALPISAGIDGRDAIQIFLSKTVSLLPTNYYNVVDYTGSGGQINVFDGNDPLIYNDTTYPAGSFYVTAVSSDLDDNVTLDITPGAITGNGVIGEIADHSGMQSDLEKAEITYTIYVNSNLGETYNFDIVQNVQKIIARPTWSISANPENFSFTSVRGFLSTADLLTFSSTFTVYRDALLYTYNETYSVGDDTFRYGTITPSSGLTYDVNSTTGAITILNTATIVTVSTVTDASFIVEIVDNNTDLVVGTRTISITKNVTGVSWSVVGTNENHSFVGDETGLVADSTTFSCSFVLTLTNGTYTYDAAGNTGDDSFKFGTLVGTNVTAEVSAGGVITINAGSSLLSGTTITTGEILVPIIDNYDGGTIIEKVITFTKVIKGTAGNEGYNAATLTAYKRASSAPVDDPGIVTYTFATANWTPANGWSKEMTAGSDPLYAVSATAYSNTADDQIEAAEWSSPTLIIQDGTSGDDGNSIHISTIYQQVEADPGSPSNDGSYNFATNTLTPPTGWVITQPSTTTTPTWACNYTFVGTPTSTVNVSGSWGVTRVDAVAGDGGNGTSIAVVEMYKEDGGTLPTLTTYRFSTGVVSTTGSLNGWSQTMPTVTTSPMYMTTCRFTAIFPDDDDANSSWTPEVLVAQNGASGSAVFTGTVYRQILADPGSPTGGSYNFSTNTLTPPTNWVVLQPTTTTTPTWACEYVFAGDVDSTVNATTWGDTRIDAVAGEDGGSGSSIAVVEMYKEDGGTLPTDTTYTFSTGEVSGTLNGWVQDMPTVTTSPMYMTTCSFVAQYPTDFEVNSNWTPETIVAQNGIPGDDGLNVASVIIYQRTVTDSAPTLPSISTEYTFADGSWVTGPNNGWSTTLPIFTGTEIYLWATTATASNTATTDVIASGEWATARKLSEMGIAGVRGGSVFTFEESTTAQISATNVVAWAGTIDTAAAQAAAAAVIADTNNDGYIRPNDRITISDISASIAGTRVYTGSATASSGSVDTGSFSSLVTEIFDGSVIVEGTLSADALAANTILTNDINISSSMTIGASGGTGIIHSPNKTTYADTDAGFYLDTNGNVHIGDTNSSIKFDTTDGVQIEGDIQSANYAVTPNVSAAGWQLNNTGSLIATDIEIYAPDGTLLIDGNTSTIAANWSDIVDDGNAPADNADVTRPGLTCLKDHTAWSLPNLGEAYFHGFDAAGNAADVQGWMYFNGVKTVMPLGYVNPGASGEGYVIYNTTGAVTDGILGYGTAYKSDGTWKRLSGTAITPTPTMYAIGTIKMSAAEVMDSITVWTAPVLLNTLGDITATNPQDSDWLTNNVVSDTNQITAANVGTFIADLAVTNAKIGNTIESIGFSVVEPASGWRLDKSGAIIARDLSLLNADGSVFLQAGEPIDFSNIGGVTAPDDNATVGATWDTNLNSIPTNLDALTGTEVLDNTAITISADGTLNDAGGGQVTVAGIGAETPAGAAILADAAEQNAKDYADAGFVLTTTHTLDLEDLQSQIDGNITSWFYSGAPTLLNEPYISWADDIERDNHIGDLYYDEVTQYAYRFKKVSTVYSWEQLSDSAIAAALAVANTAQDTADDKRRVFVSTPSGPYDIGDLWDNSGTVLRATADRASGYLVDEWTDIANYVTNTSQLTDDADLGLTATWVSVADKPSDTELLNVNTTPADIGYTGDLNATENTGALADQDTVSLTTDVTGVLPVTNTEADVTDYADTRIDNDQVDATFVGLGNVTDGADVTGDNTALNTTNVGGTLATTVESNAAGALAATDAMTDDGIFSTQEKLVWQYQWPGMDSNYTNILTQATTYGIQAETVFTTFTTNRDTLNTFLVTTHDINNAVLVNTPLTGTTFKDNVTAFYSAMSVAVNRLAEYTTLADVDGAGTLAGQDNITYGTDIAGVEGTDYPPPLADSTASAISATIAVTSGGLKMTDTSTGDYVHMSPGSLEFFVDDVLYKSVRRTQVSYGSSGTAIIFDEPFQAAPTVMCSMRDLTVYDASYSGLDQTINVQATSITNTGFTPVVELVSTGSQSYVERTADVNIRNTSFTHTTSHDTCTTLSVYITSRASYTASEEDGDCPDKAGIIKIEYALYGTSNWTTYFNGSHLGGPLGWYWYHITGVAPGKYYIKVTETDPAPDSGCNTGIMSFSSLRQVNVTVGSASAYATGDVNWLAIE